MKLIALAVSCVLSGVAVGQPAHKAGAIRVVDQPPSAAFEGRHVPGPRPERGTLGLVNAARLTAEFQAAPLEQLGEDLATYGLPIDLPHPEGGMVTCFIARSAVMENGLAARFPQFHTVVAQTADGSAGGRLELTPRGLTGMLRANRPDGDGDTWMIDLWQSADPTLVISYWLRDLPNAVDWVCETTPGVHGEATTAAEAGGYSPRVLRTFKTFRLAVACTGEYGVHHSTLQNNPPNVQDPMAAILTVVSRTNVVYENDMAVRFLLVANNDQLIFLDPETDPYDATCSGGGGADCSGNLLAPNAATLADRIGNANFDVGHLLTRIYGGVAMLGSVCNNTNKARGISGIPRGGDIDPLSALVPIHELGHQFGAPHTFSGVRGRCEGNVSLSSAYEAGSGSSPMAYAGGCPVGDAPPSDNVAQFADPWFHSSSINDMRAFLNSTNASCAVTTTSTNNIPEVVTLPASQPIPPGTPFSLTVVANDPDNDPLTYSWEQFDSGVARPIIGGTDNGAGALFRIFPPVTTPTRTFPRWESVLSGTPTPGEMLPTFVGGQRRFRVVMRDNRAAAGGTLVSSTRTLTVSGTGPFAIIDPGAGEVRRSGQGMNVSWSTGGTEASPFSLTSVSLRLSLDNGATFPVLLGTYPNNGAATVQPPAIPQSVTARVLMEAPGKVFFAVSGPFFLRPPCSSDFNNDGDFGTDQDIEAFFACLGGACCGACDPLGSDFNADGDAGTDADIEAFFRALAGSGC